MYGCQSAETMYGYHWVDIRVWIKALTLPSIRSIFEESTHTRVVIHACLDIYIDDKWQHTPCSQRSAHALVLFWNLICVFGKYTIYKNADYVQHMSNGARTQQKVTQSWLTVCALWLTVCQACMCVTLRSYYACLATRLVENIRTISWTSEWSRYACLAVPTDLQDFTSDLSF
jgi:hypothetical protein